MFQDALTDEQKLPEERGNHSMSGRTWAGFFGKMREICQAGRSQPPPLTSPVLGQCLGLGTALEGCAPFGSRPKAIPSCAAMRSPERSASEPWGCELQLNRRSHREWPSDALRACYSRVQRWREELCKRNRIFTEHVLSLLKPHYCGVCLISVFWTGQNCQTHEL